MSSNQTLLLCNLRDNPVHDNLIIDGNNVEQVDLGTVIGKKLRFQEHSMEVVKKALKRLYMMKELYARHVSLPLRIQCYTTFIESICYTILVCLQTPLSSV